MTSAPFGSRLLDGLLSDAETSALFTDRAALEAMLQFEAALARAEERCGVIPPGCAEAAVAAARALEPDLDALAAAVRRDGHPVTALVRQLRAAAGPLGQYVHWGATSQDAVDSALVIRLREALAGLDARLEKTIALLSQHAEAHRATVMAGRTRWRQAVPISFGLKAAGWAAPLKRHRRRLAELRPRLLVVQFGGAAGALAALGNRGIAVSEALAKELDLGLPPMPWHTQRDSFGEAAAWLALVTASTGKIGRDLALLAQDEIAEADDGSGGGSSTMPQKSNPVLSEILVTAATVNAGLSASMQQAALQEHERGGAGWTAEWLLLPQMTILAGTALRHAATIAGALDVRVEKMRRNIEAAGGLLLAEASAYALAAHMPLEKAQALVSQACREASASGRGLIEVLRASCAAPVDWGRLRDPVNSLGSADAFISRVLEAEDR